MMQKLPIILILFFCLYSSSSNANEIDYSGTIKEIALEIEALKKDFPQLKNFFSKNIDENKLVISYGYSTYRSKSLAGWTKGVPNPNKDGIWFHLSFYDPKSDKQIHTQPIVHIPTCIGKKRVSLLILEGEETKSLSLPIWKILRKYGVYDCK